MDNMYILVAIPTELIEDAGIDVCDVVQIYAAGSRIVIETPDTDDFDDNFCSMCFCCNNCARLRAGCDNDEE